VTGPGKMLAKQGDMVTYETDTVDPQTDTPTSARRRTRAWTTPSSTLREPVDSMGVFSVLLYGEISAAGSSSGLSRIKRGVGCGGCG
jgi:hypothetical protein